MSCLGNIIWFIFGGFIHGLTWAVVGFLWCITIVGAPIGIQCFKFAALAFSPFGKEIEYGGGATSLILNILWLIFGGLALAIEAATIGAIYCVTIIGIPFGLQYFKLAKLSLSPFGSTVK